MTWKDELAKLLTLKHAITMILSWFLIKFGEMLESGLDASQIWPYMPLFLVFLAIYLILWMEDIIPQIAKYFQSKHIG